MCINCYKENGSPKIINEKTIKGSQLVSDIYDQEDCGAGGYAHIVVDDWNLDDSSIDWCIEYCNSEDKKHFLNEGAKNACIICLNYLKELSVEERYSVMAIHDGFM